MNNSDSPAIIIAIWFALAHGLCVDPESSFTAQNVPITQLSVIIAIASTQYYNIEIQKVREKDNCMSMRMLLLSLLWCLVEVHSQQTFPYVSFMGQNLANNSYVDVSGGEI